jgi:hypothetical protein
MTQVILDADDEERSVETISKRRRKIGLIHNLDGSGNYGHYD